MKILYIGVNKGTSMDRANALKREGHEVYLIDLLYNFNRIGFVSAWIAKTGSLLFETILYYSLAIKLNKLKTNNFDIAWVNNPYYVNERMLKLLKNKSSKQLVYINDDPFGSRDGIKWRLLLKSLPLYDLVVVVRDVNIKEAHKLKAKKVLKVLMSADEINSGPVTLTENEQKIYKSEVVFVGTAFPERGPFIKKLIELGVPIAVWGNRWNRLEEWESIKPFYRGKGLSSREFIKALTGSQICIGLLSKENRDQTTQRSFEIPYSGNLLCAERTNEHESIYRDNEEAIFWSTPEECAHKCIELLKDTNKIKQIKQNGRNRVIEGGYLNQNVVREIISNL